MRKPVVQLAIALTACLAGSVHATDINVGVTVSGEVLPGVYGRVDIGNTPPPVLYAQPVIITKPVRTVAGPPLYMHVPPGHARNWGKHCHKYSACARPVYFVKSGGYEGGRGGGKEKHHKHNGNGHGHGRGRD